MSTLSNPRLAKGSTIFITGVTGYIGSWVAYTALDSGYKVRGAVRSIEKASWLQAFFDAKFPGCYSQVQLSSALDFETLDKITGDVDGVIHVATDTSLLPDPEPYVSNIVKATENILKAAQKHETVKSVVLTSSSVAGYQAAPNTPLTISKDDYNDLAVKLAYDPSFTPPGKEWIVYAASKVQSEKAAWRFMQEEKPHFVLNTVLPDLTLGPALDVAHQDFPSTSGWAKALFDGKTEALPQLPPNWFIDVRDAARLHIAALLSPDIASERLWGFTEPVSFDHLVKLFKQVWPERKFVEDLPDMGRNMMTPPNEGALRALKAVFGLDKFVPLEQTVKDMFQPVIDGHVK